MKRNIIHIDEAKCNGCGQCIIACAEAALKLVNGKAKLVKENFCDGFGDCIGECPTGALTIEKRAAADFDFEDTKSHVSTERGIDGLRQLETAARKHSGASEPPPASGSGKGCPGTHARVYPDKGNS
ncbi:MAG: 4Fe-4S binding protein [Lentisphaerae bacterium]|nr:4Fe-4S binding protein [Lentisphaerota bacterium]